MEEPLQAGLARFISGCSLEKIPEKFKADARLRILDWAGCAIAGAHYPQTVIAGRYLSSVGGAAESTAIGLDDRLPARSAAFLNGVAGHVCELDDGHRTAIGHPGSVTIPVALALAEKTGATGADFLKAIIIGYDTFARLGRTVNPSHYKTWHTTGTVGTVAAAVDSLPQWQAVSSNHLAPTPKPSISQKPARTGSMRRFSHSPASPDHTLHFSGRRGL